MEIEISRSTPFDTEDMMALRAFFETRAGSRLLPRLLADSPVNLAKGDVNEILIRSGEVRGWAQVATALLGLAYPPPEFEKKKEGSAGYASLDDDEKWNDGQKLEKENKTP